MNVKKNNNMYTELAKPRITETRKLIISKVNNGKEEHYKMVELAEVIEGTRKYTTILKGGIEIHSLICVRNLRDALNKVLDDAGFYETETGESPQKLKVKKFDTTEVKPRRWNENFDTCEVIEASPNDVKENLVDEVFEDKEDKENFVDAMKKLSKEFPGDTLDDAVKSPKEIDKLIEDGYTVKTSPEDLEKIENDIKEKGYEKLEGLTWNEKQFNKSSTKEDFEKAFEGIKKTTNELAKETDFEEVNKQAQETPRSVDEIASYMMNKAKKAPVDNFVEPYFEEDEDPWEDVEEPTIGDLPEGFEDYSINALFALCEERGLKTSRNKSRSYFINLLQKSVDK